MSKRDIGALNAKLLIAVERKSRDEVERLLDLGAEADASYRDDVYVIDRVTRFIVVHNNSL